MISKNKLIAALQAKIEDDYRCMNKACDIAIDFNAARICRTKIATQKMLIEEIQSGVYDENDDA